VLYLQLTCSLKVCVVPTVDMQFEGLYCTYSSDMQFDGSCDANCTFVFEQFLTI
jgi:hypothetical protein